MGALWCPPCRHRAWAGPGTQDGDRRAAEWGLPLAPLHSKADKTLIPSRLPPGLGISHTGTGLQGPVALHPRFPTSCCSRGPGPARLHLHRGKGPRPGASRGCPPDWEAACHGAFDLHAARDPQPSGAVPVLLGVLRCHGKRFQAPMIPRSERCSMRCGLNARRGWGTRAAVEFLSREPVSGFWMD